VALTMVQTELNTEVPVQAGDNDEEETATMCRTKAGNGFKVVYNGLWFYTSKAQVMDFIEGRAKACTFHTIKE
jgi:hypothetical protein